MDILYIISYAIGIILIGGLIHAIRSPRETLPEKYTQDEKISTVVIALIWPISIFHCIIVGTGNILFRSITWTGEYIKRCFKKRTVNRHERNIEDDQYITKDINKTSWPDKDIISYFRVAGHNINSINDFIEVTQSIEEDSGTVQVTTVGILKEESEEKNNEN